MQETRPALRRQIGANQVEERTDESIDADALENEVIGASGTGLYPILGMEVRGMDDDERAVSGGKRRQGRNPAVSQIVRAPGIDERDVRAA
jgi:hypothetical protein